jgi:hypothetical protein
MDKIAVGSFDKVPGPRHFGIVVGMDGKRLVRTRLFGRYAIGTGCHCLGRAVGNTAKS